MYLKGNFGMGIATRKKITPTRDRSQNTAKEMHQMQQGYLKTNDYRNLSPNKLNATKKPRINFGSPRMKQIHRNFSNPRIDTDYMLNCVNHTEKNAQFFSKINGQNTLFCEKCAVHLASQGIQIARLHQNKNNPKPKDSMKNLKYEGRPEYQQMKKFLKILSKSEEIHSQQFIQLGKIDKHYRQQINLTQRFYNQLIQTIAQMRDDHIDDLVREGEKDSQIAEIEKGYLEENINLLTLFKTDIQNRFDQIIEQYKDSRSQFEKIMNFYGEKIGMFQLKTDSVGEFLKNIINYKKQDLSKQKKAIEEFLFDSWGRHKSSDEKENIRQFKETKNNVKKVDSKAIVKILNRQGNQQERENCCRQLFTENEHQGGISPEFKKI